MLNSQPLVSGKDKITGRFTLYSTKNYYNFILVDQVNGNSWQVQWGFEPANYMIIPIPGVNK